MLLTAPAKGFCHLNFLVIYQRAKTAIFLRVQSMTTFEIWSLFSSDERQKSGEVQLLGAPRCIQEKIGMECFISCTRGLEFVLHTGSACILLPPAPLCPLTYITCALDSLGDIAP